MILQQILHLKQSEANPIQSGAKEPLRNEAKPPSATENCQFCRCHVLLTAAAECLHMFCCRHTAADCHCIKNIPWFNVAYKTFLNAGLSWNDVLDTGEYPGTFQTTNHSDTKEFNMCCSSTAADCRSNAAASATACGKSTAAAKSLCPTPECKFKKNQKRVAFFWGLNQLKPSGLNRLKPPGLNQLKPSDVNQLKPA
jgi:hypothetical protein